MQLNIFLRSQNKDAEILMLKADSISPCPFQPRHSFDERLLNELAKSISQVGILQPLTVRKANGGYQLVCGERRLRAARLADLDRVPCSIAELSDSEAAIAALAENLQRQDLGIFEQAEGIKKLISEFGMTRQQAAVSLGLSQPVVANKLRLLKLSETQREIIEEYGLTERHARALLKTQPEMRNDILHTACKESLTAEGLEHYIDELAESEKQKKSYRRRARSVGDVRLFFNTVEKALKVMQLAGVNASTEKKFSDGFIEYIIKIPSN